MGTSLARLLTQTNPKLITQELELGCVARQGTSKGVHQSSKQTRKTLNDSLGLVNTKERKTLPFSSQSY